MRTLRGKRRAPLGMTLIEIMVVMVVIGGLMAASVVLFNDISRNNIKSQALRLSGYIKYTYGQAAIRQEYYRLVMDINTHEYWVEVAERQDFGSPPAIPKTEIIGGPEEFVNKSKKTLFDDGEETAFGIKRPTFTTVDERLAKKRKLAGGVEFESVTKSYDQGPIEAGRVAMVFYPNGFVDQTVIVIKDPSNDSAFSLEVQPLTGKVTFYNGRREADRDFFEVEDDD